jgi:hypothetical protein
MASPKSIQPVDPPRDELPVSAACRPRILLSLYKHNKVIASGLVRRAAIDAAGERWRILPIGTQVASPHCETPVEGVAKAATKEGC